MPRREWPCTSRPLVPPPLSRSVYQFRGSGAGQRASSLNFSLQSWTISPPDSHGFWEPYLEVIRENCSEALHILDRFYIAAKMIRQKNSRVDSRFRAEV
jgi:hypothetical protein